MFLVNRVVPVVALLFIVATTALVVARSGGTGEPTTLESTDASPARDAGSVDLVAAENEGAADSVIDPPIASTTTTEPPPDYSGLGAPGSTERIVGVTTQTGTRTEVDEFATAAGRRPNVLMRLVGWEHDDYHRWFLEDAAEQELLVLLSWEPWDHEKESTIEQQRSEQPDYSVERILEGTYDDYIDEWAEGLADWEYPVALRFAHEMNGFWYPWSDGRNGNQSGDYVRLWRYVYERFERAGADNVIWVWSPNIDAPTLSALEPLYPGDEYVDWIGLSGYFGHGKAIPTEYPSYEDIFGPTITQIQSFTDLPMVITETGATERGGLKAEFITDLLNSMADEEDLLGFVWFEVEKETDWRIVSSDAASRAFATALIDDRWNQPPSLSASALKAAADSAELRMRQSVSFW